MDTDLFSLQGIVVEKDNVPATELFSLQGVVIEKSRAVAAAGQLRLLATQNTTPLPQVGQLRLLATQSSPGFTVMPTDITGLENFKVMAQRRATVTLDWTTLDISKPTVLAAPSRTRVDLTPSLSNNYRQRVALAYQRLPMNVLEGLALVPGSISTLAEFVDAVRAKGHLIEMGDLDQTRSKITAQVIKVYAHNDSYFFYKDSYVVFGGEPTLADEFAVTVAQGFNPA